MTGSDVAALARSMAATARELQRASTTREAWDSIVTLAVDRLDGVDHAGVTVVRRGRPQTTASSGPVPAQVDRLQYQAEQGPCLDAILERHSFRTGDLAHEVERWPAFGPRAAAETGVRSMAAFRLFVGAQTMGSLNLYGERVNAFSDTTMQVAAVYAAHAALALDRIAESERADNLERALDSSRQIGAAIGILMAYHRVTQEQAFDLLKAFSQNTNRKLRDVAGEVVDTGALPDRR